MHRGDPSFTKQCMSYLNTDPLAHSLNNDPPRGYQQPGRNPQSIISTSPKNPRGEGQFGTSSRALDRKSSQRSSVRGGSMTAQDQTIAYAEQLAQNEVDFVKEQKYFLNSELHKQAQEKELQRKLEAERKTQEHTHMLQQEQHQKSLENIRKQHDAENQKNLLDDYQSAIANKRTLQGIEKTVELNLAKNMEHTARDSLYHEKNQRKELLSKFQDEFRKDYEDRMNTKRGHKDQKAMEQAEYRRLFEQNAQRELANEAAYKKRFQDFDRNLDKKSKKYYQIVNQNDMERDRAVSQITGQGRINYNDYFDEREKQKTQKAEELKENCYQSMKSTIEAKQKFKNDLSSQRREEAK
uniref:Uncharacterized protein n=1 Tax=Euplotes crassus TaxID=5936 RepID=A0A7S3NSH1_EUPCR|mmetsp:Transcript_12397/g.12438  ORF Transcript_12397/g.12438 Transcript_12397/m.12438 type:complete len:353 (+) Transcript_12397:14-1072(+)